MLQPRREKPFKIYTDPPGASPPSTPDPPLRNRTFYTTCLNEDSTIRTSISSKVVDLSITSRIHHWKSTLSISPEAISFYADEHKEVLLDENLAGKEQGVEFGNTVYFTVDREWDAGWRRLKARWKPMDRRPVIKERRRRRKAGEEGEDGGRLLLDEV